jgi:GNAT superfamily N-acetyltransferase
VSLETNDELMRIHAATLFNLDDSGRIVSLRRPSRRPKAPPRFFMGRTLTGHVWHFRRDLAEDLIRELELLCRSEPLAPSLTIPPRKARDIRTALGVRGPVANEYRGPAYLIPETARVPSAAVVITKDNGYLLEAAFPWMLPHVMADVDIGPVTATVANGRAVSICYCARLSPLAAEAGVETLESLRGQGFATAAVAAWAAAARARGLVPLYSAAWENPASQRVAEKLGAVCYGEDWEIE